MEDRLRDIVDEVCCRQCDVRPEVLEEVVRLAVEVAREGREGRKIGTLFTVGAADEVMQRSRAMILDPLKGHPDGDKFVRDANVRETIKELAQLDGAFVVTDEGIVRSAARYLDAPTDGIELPLGLGSRHLAGASITRITRTVAVVVSESSVVRIFHDGALISEIIPEIWMMRRHGLVLPTEASRHDAGDRANVTR